MRLTVGPHPAAVYWRRRALVLAVLAVFVMIIMYACGGTGSSSADPQQPSGGTASPTTTTTLLHPTIPTPTQTRAPTPTAFSLPTKAASTGPCTDAEISVTVTPGATKVHRGSPVSLEISFKNSSGRTCTRDVGADAQEIRLLDGDGLIIWSSDDCAGGHGTDVRTFRKGQVVTFTPSPWSGRRSRSGTGTASDTICDENRLPDVGRYQLVGRLGSKLSAPVTIQVDP